MKNQKGFLPVIMILVVLLVVASAYYLGTLKPKQNGSNAIPTPVAEESVEMQPSSVSSPTSTTVQTGTTYVAPSTWTRATMNNGLKVCLPPKWENTGGTDDLVYNRDVSYKPTITTITSIPYESGSTLQAYYDFWKNEYPDISQLVLSRDIDINGNKAKLISPKGEVKSSPEGLTVIWYTPGKLWKAGLSNWSMINSSQTTFLSDFYRMISCSF